MTPHSRHRTGRSGAVVETACPLDCPDSCSLEVTLEDGRITSIDGSASSAGHRRLHLRQGAAVRRPRLRRGSDRASRAAGAAPRAPAASSRSSGTRRSIASRKCSTGATKLHGGEAILPVLLRRVQRSRLAGHGRRSPVPPARRVAARAHRVRGADDAPQRRHSTDEMAVGRLRGLRPRPADRRLGREPVDVGHPPRTVHPGGAAARRDARGDRSADDPARAHGGPAPGGQARNGPRGRARGPPSPVRGGRRRRGVPVEHAHEGRGSPAGAGGAVDVRPRGADRRRRRRSDRAVRPALRRTRRPPSSAAGGASSATATAGARRSPCWRCQRSPGSSACAAAGTRCPSSGAWTADADVDRRRRARHARRQHEPSRPCADRRAGPAGSRALRLQLQPGRHAARSEPDPRRAWRARISSRWSSTRS